MRREWGSCDLDSPARMIFSQVAVSARETLQQTPLLPHPFPLPLSTKTRGGHMCAAHAPASVFFSPSPLKALRERGTKGERVPPWGRGTSFETPATATPPPLAVPSKETLQQTPLLRRHPRRVSYPQVLVRTLRRHPTPRRPVQEAQAAADKARTRPVSCLAPR